MGSWNETCVVSHQSIYGNQDVVALIMAKNPNENIYSRIKGETYFMTPLCLPFQGKYTEYGTIGKVKKTPYTDQIKKITGISVEQVINFLADKALHLEYGLDFESRMDKWKWMKKWLNKYKEDQLVTPALLKSWGMVQKSPGFFNFPKTQVPLIADRGLDLVVSHSDQIVLTKDKLTLHSSKEGESSEFVTDDLTAQSVINFVHKYSNYLLNIKPQGQSTMQLLMNLEVCWIHAGVYDKIKNIDDNKFDLRTWDSFQTRRIEEVKRSTKSLNHLPKKIRKMEMERQWKKPIERIVGEPFANFHAKDLGKETWYKKEFKGFWTFMTVINQLGIKLMPQYSGAQCGVPELHQAVCQIFLETYKPHKD